MTTTLNLLSEPKFSLIKEPTPVSRLANLGKDIGTNKLFIKREDQTASGYGGNKVRNLEYIFGEAIKLGAEKLVTPAPLGSNFVAALASQIRKTPLNCDIFQFVPHRNEQLNAHARFSVAMSGDYFNRLPLMHHWFSAPIGYGEARIRAKLHSQSYFVSPGGSSLTGAMGHVNAALELKEQIDKGELPEPDYIVTGAGTCGTIAGLIVGLKVAGLRTKVVGVRCVDKVLCNRIAILNYSRRLRRKLNLNSGITANDIILLDPPSGKMKYGEAHNGARETIDLMKDLEGIRLDTTYTSKVVLKLIDLCRNSSFLGKNILYWHTFSDTALKWNESVERYPISTVKPSIPFGNLIGEGVI